MLSTTDHGSGACGHRIHTPLTFEGARTSKRGKIVLKASVTARICRICTSTIFCCSIRDKIQTMLKNNCECGPFASTDDSII